MMLDKAAVRRRRGRTDWRRAAVVLLPGTLTIGLLGAAMAQGALAASIAVSGNHFVVTADSVRGDKVVVYPEAVSKPDGTSEESLKLGFATGKISRLCLSSQTDLPVVGPVALVLQSGGPTDVTVTDFVADARSVDGTDGVLRRLRVGVDASTLRDVPGAEGPAGRFGVGAGSLEVKNFRSTASSVTGADLRLAGLHLDVRRARTSAC